MREAEYYQKLDDEKVQCLLCPVNCVILPGKPGRCRSRQNIDGKLLSLNFGKTVSINPYDPVEKKPLFHFLPGERILSIGANYCNLHCNYCQNYQISQFKANTADITKEGLLQLTREHRLNSVAYTYTEPVIWYEFMKESASYLQSHGMKTVMVTNGYINQEPWAALLPHISAVNIDLKSIRDDFYQRNCKGTVQPVLDSIRYAAEHCHLEITNLLITGENDSDEDINDLIDFVDKIDPRIPLHFSRYYPCYQLNNPATDPERLYYAYKQAKKKLAHVYLGNLIFDNRLICENCKADLGARGYNISLKIKDGRCPECGQINYGIWK